MSALAEGLESSTIEFYTGAMDALDEARIPFLVGGAWAFEAHTGIGGRTKDLDLFLREEHVEAALARLAAAGSERTELTSPIWIGKALRGEDVIDLIFSSGNGLCAVDDAWFDNARRTSILGRDVDIIPIEEMIWSKAFLMERDRFDGADVQHLVLAANGAIDGERLLKRFGLHWRVLLAHLVLFDYAFPTKRDLVPPGLRDALAERAAHPDEAVESGDERDLCYGTFLSRHLYRADIESGDFVDARGA